MQSQESDSWKIDLPGGGFIQKPGAQLRPVSGEIDLPGGGFIQRPGSELRPPSDAFPNAEIDGGGFIQKPGAQLRAVSGEIDLPGGGFIQKPGSELRPVSDDFASTEIDLPGGGFIQKPGSELRPVSDEFASAEIDLPGGGSIQKPGLELRPVSDEFASAEERQMLMDKLDELLAKRAAKENALQDLLTEEKSLTRSLKDVNDALDSRGWELSWMTETLRADRNKMLARLQEKKARLVDLREFLSSVEREERKTASYKIIANESRALRKKISEAVEEKRVLLKKMDDLKWMEKLSKKRVKLVLQEEKTLWMKISERVQWMAENGQLPLKLGNEPQQAVKDEELVEQDQAGSDSEDVQAEKNPDESDKKSVHLLADKDEELAKREQNCDEKQEDRKEEDQASSQKTESKDVQAEETPAESDKKSVHLDENQSGKEEELAKKDQASDENHEDRKEEDQTSSQEINCPETKDKPLKISPASTQPKRKSKKKESKKEKKEKKKTNKKTKDDEQKKVLYEGMQFKDSLKMDQPGGTWAETCSTTSTQSVDSAAVPPTVVTVQAEIHHPTTNHKRESMRRSMRPSDKQIAAQLASNREQLKLAEKIELIEQLELQEKGEEVQEGNDAKEGEDKEEGEENAEEEQIKDVVIFEFEEDLEVAEESSKKRGCFSFLRNLFKRFKFGSKKTPPPQKKSRAARRKEMAVWSETLHAPTELITGEVLMARQTV